MCEGSQQGCLRSERTFDDGTSLLLLLLLVVLLLLLLLWLLLLQLLLLLLSMMRWNPLRVFLGVSSRELICFFDNNKIYVVCENLLVLCWQKVNPELVFLC